jgi:hypothetical protein
MRTGGNGLGNWVLDCDNGLSTPPFLGLADPLYI